ncbi:MAG: signal peptidase I [Enterococcus viikkiensis]
MANIRPSQGHTDPREDRKAAMLTVLILVALFVSILFVINGQLKKNLSIHTISGTSMVPTLTEKDMVIVQKRTPIQRYDIVAFSVTKEEGMFVKRVIGLPGDSMLVRNGRMVLDIGEQGDFETTSSFQLAPTVAEEFQTLNKIPEDVYFVIGDHVDVSKDSRTFGFVQQKAIEGTVQFRLPVVRLAKSEK